MLNDTRGKSEDLHTAIATGTHAVTSTNAHLLELWLNEVLDDTRVG